MPIVKFNDELYEYITYEEFEQILETGCPIKALDYNNTKAELNQQGE